MTGFLWLCGWFHNSLILVDLGKCMFSVTRSFWILCVFWSVFVVCLNAKKVRKNNFFQCKDTSMHSAEKNLHIDRLGIWPFFYPLPPCLIWGFSPTFPSIPKIINFIYEVGSGMGPGIMIHVRNHDYCHPYKKELNNIKYKDKDYFWDKDIKYKDYFWEK